MKELTEGFVDTVTKPQEISKSEGWSKNVLRPVRVDGTDATTGRFSNRANKSAFSGVEGTKGQHDANLAILKAVPRDTKITGKNKRKYTTTKNNLGKVVRCGKITVVKAKNVAIDLKKKRKNTGVPVKATLKLSELLKDIK